MFKILYGAINTAYNKKIDGHGLAAFRIAYSLVLLGEIAHIYYYRHLIFDKIPYLVPGEIDLSPALIFWMISVLGIIFGMFTRIATIVNYILTVAVVGTTSSFEYHMFYAYLGINVMLMFMPISRCFSLDRLFAKLKYSNTKFRYTPSSTVSSLNYLIPIALGIGFVYFDSIFHKLASDFWSRGLGMWLPSVLPQTVFFDTTFVMNQKWLVIGLGYLTFVFEALFLFVFWRKKWRLLCFFIGLGLHLGILVCYPIPFFALGVVAIYMLLIPVSFWKKYFGKRRLAKADRILYYDAECPLCVRTAITLQHLDGRGKISFVAIQEGKLDARIDGIPLDDLFRNIHLVDGQGNVRKGIDSYIGVFSAIWYLKPISWGLRLPIVYPVAKRVYNNVAVNRTTERCTVDSCEIQPLEKVTVENNNRKLLHNVTVDSLNVTLIAMTLLFAFFFQLAAVYNSPLLRNLKNELGLQNSQFVRISNGVARKISDFSRIYFGITQHGVFMDTHFYNYNHSIGVVYKDGDREIWLPLTEEDGLPGDYLIGHNWVKYTFRVNGPNINQETLSDGIRDFTAFWAHKSGISLDNAKFYIMVKKNRQPTEWEKDFLHKQLSNPWIDAGAVYWENGVFRADIMDIEAL